MLRYGLRRLKARGETTRRGGRHSRGKPQCRGSSEAHFLPFLDFLGADMEGSGKLIGKREIWVLARIHCFLSLLPFFVTLFSSLSGAIPPE